MSEKLRPYQERIVGKIMEHPLGGIALLRTGSGKTLIAMEIISRSVDRAPQGKRAALVVVPTSVLTDQQCLYAKKQLGAKFKHIAPLHGDVSLPCDAVERLKLGDAVLVVATADKFLNFYRGAGLSLEVFCVVIFDEVHHTSKKHPYRILSDAFEDLPLKRVGMTASLCYEKDAAKIPVAASEVIISVLGPGAVGMHFSEVVHTATAEELRDACIANPAEAQEEILPVHFLWSKKVADLRANNLPLEFLALLKQRDVRVHPVLQGVFDELVEVEKNVDTYFNGDGDQPFSPTVAWECRYSFDALGGAVAHAIVKCEEFIGLEVTATIAMGQGVFRRNIPYRDLKGIVADLKKILLLTEVVRMLVTSRQRYLELAIHYMCDMDETRDILSPKFSLWLKDVRRTDPELRHEVRDILVKRLQNHMSGREFQCRAALFLEQRLAAAILADMMQKEWPNINPHDTKPTVRRVDWMCAQQSPSAFIQRRNRKEVVENFREKDTLVICATSVMEEGIDVGQLSLVIHVDAPNNPISTVQRAGRARAQDAEAFSITAASGTKLDVLTAAVRFQEEFTRYGVVRAVRVEREDQRDTCAELLREMQKWPKEMKEPLQVLNELRQRRLLDVVSDTEPLSAGSQNFKGIVRLTVVNHGEGPHVTGKACALGKQKAKTDAAQDAIARLYEFLRTSNPDRRFA